MRTRQTYDIVQEYEILSRQNKNQTYLPPTIYNLICQKQKSFAHNKKLSSRL